MNTVIETMTARPRVLNRALAAAAAAVVVSALAALPAAADVPPAGVGTTSHGFLVKNGVLTTIDHPDAATIPSTPEDQTGTGTAGINDHGEIVGVYQDRDRVVRHFVRNRKGRFAVIADPAGTRSDRLSYEAIESTTAARSSAFSTTRRGTRRPVSCAPAEAGSRHQRPRFSG